METSLATGFKASIVECVFALAVFGGLESTGGAGFGFTQNSYDLCRRKFVSSTEFPKGIMLIFKSFEGAQMARFVCEGILLMVSGEAR